MTSALNATIITGNGNEGILQNDMGNTLIKDSITGSIMSLNDGFVPLGIKEYGGILYIASYNPKTKEGELGSIPSPIIHYNVNGLVNNDKLSTINISDLGETKQELYTDKSISERLNTDTLYVLNDHLFHGGDKFMVQLNLSLDKKEGNIENKTYRKCKLSEIQFPQITQRYNIDDNSNWDGEIKKGWFRIELYSILETGSEIRLTDLEGAQHYYNRDGLATSSKYWFLTADDKLDEILTRTSDMYRTYPNIPSGRLAIKFVPEYPGELSYLPNGSYGADLPQIYSLSVENEGVRSSEKYVIVPGFKFNADCPIMPDLIRVVCNNGDIKVATIDNKSWDNVGKIKVVPADQKYGSTNAMGDNNSIPYSIRPGLGSYRINKSFDAYRSCDTEGSYIISKYSDPEEYFKKTVLNRDPNDHDGIFWVKLDDWNTDVQFTLYLYTRAFDELAETDGEYNDEDIHYVLYSIQTMPKFNPATIEVGEGDIVQTEEVPQYFDITGIDKTGFFDIPLFEHSENKCFLYGGDENGIYDYDQESRLYKLVYKIVDGKTTKEVVTFDDLSTFKTYIYPQTVKEVLSEYKTDKNNPRYGANGLRFLWNEVSFGYRQIPNKQCFDVLTSTKLFNRDETQPGNPWTFKYEFEIEDDESNTNNGSNTTVNAPLISGYADWEWFVVSSTVPKMTIADDNGNTQQINCILPLKKTFITDYLRRQVEGGDSHLSCFEQDNDILAAAKAQRDYFNTKQNIAGLTHQQLKKYTLYGVNILQGLVDFTQRPYPGCLETLSWPQNGSYTESMMYDCDAEDPGKIFFYTGTEDNKLYKILKDPDDSFQGLTSSQRLLEFYNCFKAEEGNGYRGNWSNSISGSHYYNGGKNELISYIGDAAFYSWSPSKTINAQYEYDGQFAMSYRNSSCGSRCMHDSYFGHIIQLANYNTSDKQSTILGGNYPKLVGKPGKYSGKSVFTLFKNKDDVTSALNSLVSDNSLGGAWYAEGFITNAMKKCPGYIPADNVKEEENFHDIFNFNILNENYPLYYLYNKGFSLKFENVGDSDTLLIQPKINAKSTYCRTDNNDEWHSDDIQNIEIKEGTTILFYNGTDKKEIFVEDNNRKASYEDLLPNWWTTSGGDLNLTNKTYRYPLKLSAKIKTNGRSANKQYDLLLTDIYAAVATPQMAVFKDDSLTRDNLSDYLLKPYFKLKDENLGVYYGDGNPILTKSNIEIDNLLDGRIKNQMSILKTPQELGWVNTFDDTRSYYNSKQGIEISGKIELDVSNNDSLYVFAISANSEAEIELSLKQNGIEISEKPKFTMEQQFIPFYVKAGDKIILSDITFKDKKSYVQNQVGYIKNVGLYRIEIDGDGIDPASKKLVDYFKGHQLESGVIIDNDVLDNLIFPCIFCFKEQIYSNIISRLKDYLDDQKIFADNNNYNGNQIRAAQRMPNSLNNLGNLNTDIFANSDIVNQKFKKVVNTGCLDQKYSGFEYINSDPRFERVGIYCIDDVDDLLDGYILKYGRKGKSTSTSVLKLLCGSESITLKNVRALNL